MTMPAETLLLDLVLPADDVAALRRRLEGVLGRASRCELTWHDDPGGVLVRDGLALVSWQEGRQGGWRAERLDPGVTPGAVPVVVAEGITPDGLAGVALPDRMVPVQHLEGRVYRSMATELVLRLVVGRLDDGGRVARLQLGGPPAEVAGLALSLAEDIRLSVPMASLAADALGRMGFPVPYRALGAPRLADGLAPGAAFAHAAGHLLGVLLNHAPAAAAGRWGEPVHQMRVALRRLRALASVFRAAVACPELDEVRLALKTLASQLGPARDWDVFLDGTGPRALGAFPHEAALGALLAGAEAQRAAAYAALADQLDGQALRALAIRVAILALARPWEGPTDAAETDTVSFGTRVLARRWKQLSRRPGDLQHQPESVLHDFRLRAKRLRYAAEVFAPLFPGHGAQPFLKRLAALQESLGHLNDGAVATALMQALADQGGTGLAGGLVRGLVAGRADAARAEIARAWKRLRKADRFWT